MLNETDCESEAVWFASFIPSGINRRPDIAKQPIKNLRIQANALFPVSIQLIVNQSPDAFSGFLVSMCYKP